MLQQNRARFLWDFHPQITAGDTARERLQILAIFQNVLIPFVVIYITIGDTYFEPLSEYSFKISG